VSRSSGDASTGFSTDQVNADSAVTSQPVNSVPNTDSEYHLKVHSLPSSKFSCTIFADTSRKLPEFGLRNEERLFSVSLSSPGYVGKQRMAAWRHCFYDHGICGHVLDQTQDREDFVRKLHLCGRCVYATLTSTSSLSRRRYRNIHT
jgi:hypothetical protein